MPSPAVLLAKRPLWQVVQDFGCVAFYPLDDLSGTRATELTGRNPGAIVGGPTLGGRPLQAGETGSVSGFTTNTKYVQAKNGLILAALVNASIIVSVKPGTTGLVDKCIYSERGSAGNDIWKMDTNTGLFRLTHRDDAGTLNFLPATTDVGSGTGSNIVGMSKAGTAVTFFFNGAADGTGTITGTDTFTNATNESWIGADKGDSGKAWPGSIGFVALFNRALSATDHKAIVSAARGN